MASTKAGDLLTPRAVMTVLIGALLVLVLTTFDRYGNFGGEEYGYNRAVKTLAFLTSGGADRDGVGQFVLKNYYGAMADVLALALQRAVPSLSLDSRHLVAALFGVAGIFYACRLGGLFGSPWTGPIAALLLTFNPMWLGYMFFNIKDIPFATALLAASYHSLVVLGDERPPARLSWLGLAVWSGVLATTKLLGLPMLCVIVSILLAAWLVESRRFDPRLLAWRALGVAAAVIAGTLLCAVLFWPQLYLYSPRQLLTVLRTFMDFTPWGGKVLLNGVGYPHDKVPRHYMLSYFAISMPLFVQALFLLAAPVAVRRARLRVLGLVAVPAAFFLVQALRHTQVYNGYRHFLFLVPFMSVAAAFPLATIAEGGFPRRVKVAAAGALIAFMGFSSFTMIKFHPYQYSTYNLLVGGTEGAQGRFYIDVWRTAQREALGLLDRAVAPGTTARVYSCGTKLDFAGHGRFKLVLDPRRADYVIALPRFCPVRRFPGYRTIAEVRRGRVLFASVLAPE